MSQELSYQILGEQTQILELNLEPGQILIGDGGALLYLDEEITFETRDYDGADEVPAEEPELEEDDQEASLEEEILEEEDDFEPDLESVLDEPEEERNQTLLEKLWVVAKKNIQKIGENKAKPTEEPEALPDELNIEDELEEVAEEDKGPSWFITHFTNESEYVRKIAFTAFNAGKILPIDLSQTLARELIVQTGTFLCARKGTRLEKFLDTEQSVNFTKEKFYNLDKITSPGVVFLQSEGHHIEKELENASIRINLFSLIAFESSLSLDLEEVMRVQSMRFEDDTQFVRISGTGRYWLQAATLQQAVYRLTPFMFDPPSDMPPVESEEDRLDADLDSNTGDDEVELPEELSIDDDEAKEG